MKNRIIKWLGGITYREHFKKMDEVSEHVGVIYGTEYLPVHNVWIAYRKDTCSLHYLVACKDKNIMSMIIGSKEYAITCKTEKIALNLIDKYVELYGDENIYNL